MSKKNWYYYDVNYRLKTTSILTVLARTKTEALQKAREELEHMSKDDLVERFLAAVNFEPDFTITNVEAVEECTDEAEKEFFNIKED